MDNEYENYYISRDLYECSYLYASGLTLHKVIPQDAGYYFAFSPKLKAKQLRDDFWSNTGSITPKHYADSIKNLKNRIFANRLDIGGIRNA